MTEAQALKVFRELAPMDARLRRFSGELEEYDVAVLALHVGGPDFARVQAVAQANGCEIAVEGEPENGPPMLALDKDPDD